MLIVEADPTTARRMTAALGDGLRVPSRRAADAEHHSDGRCRVIGSLRKLFEQDLERAELVICSVNLPDGDGLIALDYLRGRFPVLPVILVGAPEDAAVAVEAIRAGAVDFLTTGHDLQTLPLAVEKCLTHHRVKQQNEQLQRDLGDSLTELAVKNQQLQALVRQLEATARTDDLTGLCNRRWLNEMLRQAWADAVEQDRRLAFLMIDLDDFKAVNDRLGHLRGDELLREIGRIIQANCRQVDISARYGGDEFCVLMPDCDAREAAHVAGRIVYEAERLLEARRADEPGIGMSIGVAHFDGRHPDSPDELIRQADDALYAAKASGKGRVLVRHHGAGQPTPTGHVQRDGLAINL